jgi:hypothetical protein
MTRREILAAIPPAFLVAGHVSVAFADDATRRTPTMDQLVNLAEFGANSRYYGGLLGEALAETGRICRDNGDRTMTLYWAELIQEKNGSNSWAWRRETVRSAEQPVPLAVLRKFRRENL